MEPFVTEKKKNNLIFSQFERDGAVEEGESNFSFQFFKLIGKRMADIMEC